MAHSKNLTSVDLFKFIASLMVVAIHAHPFMSNADVDYWFTSICRVAVPFFFVIGSYFYFKSKKPISSYIKRLLLLYLVWFIIEIPFIYERFFLNTSFFKGLAYFTRGLLINNTFYASWYITASWQATLIIYLLAKRSNILLYTVAFFCAFLSVSNASYAHLFDNSVWNIFTKITSICFASNSFIAAIPFCVIGRYIAINEDVLLKKVSYLRYVLLGFIVFGIYEIFVCRQYYLMTDSFWSLYPIIFLIVILLISYSLPINKNVSQFLRKMSIIIYLSHGIVMRLLRLWCNMEEGVSMFFLTALFSVLISYLIVKLSSKFQFLKYLY